eukprot:395139-Amphidinium_carterae.2
MVKSRNIRVLARVQHSVTFDPTTALNAVVEVRVSSLTADKLMTGDGNMVNANGVPIKAALSLANDGEGTGGLRKNSHIPYCWVMQNHSGKMLNFQLQTWGPPKPLP